MVRNLTGSLVEVGLGRGSLHGSQRCWQGPHEAARTAPAAGLTLMRVAYAEDASREGESSSSGMNSSSSTTLGASSSASKARGRSHPSV